MSPRGGGRTEACNTADAAVLLAKAEKFIDTAELVLDETDLPALSTSAALSVLGAIAASDVICCKRLGQRSRGQDHRQATELLRQVAPNGPKLAQALSRVLDVKDGSQYGKAFLDRNRTVGALRQAKVLLQAARTA